MTKTLFLILSLMAMPNGELKYNFGLYPTEAVCKMVSIQRRAAEQEAEKQGAAITVVSDCRPIPVSVPKHEKKANN